jgi:hypothetical protein
MPVLSPDGKSLAKLVRDKDVSKLHVVLQPLNGVPERTLVSLPGDDVQRRTSLAFSPDGRRLPIGWWGSSTLFISFPEGHVQETPLDKIENIGWMPDSRRVVFTSRSEETVGLFAGDTIGGSTRLLFSSVQQPGSPSVSPDGSRVAFESFTNDHNLLEAAWMGQWLEPCAQRPMLSKVWTRLHRETLTSMSRIRSEPCGFATARTRTSRRR